MRREESSGLASVRRMLAWIGRHELVVLLLLALATGGGWVFAELADEVAEGGTRDFDVALLLALRNPSDLGDPIGPEWVEETVRDITALGGAGVLGVVTLASAGYLALERKRRAALFVAAAVGGGFALSFALKHGFDRPRPDLVPHGSYVVTSSFPSGHSMLSAVTYLTLGALLARVQPRLVLKAYLLLLSVVLTLFVGFSRVYLGVHWPTDVLAGWAAGAAWATACWAAARWLQRKGRVEEDRNGASVGGGPEEDHYRENVQDFQEGSMKAEELMTLGELREQIGRFSDDTRVFFGCPDEANPLELVGVEENGGETIQIRFRLNVYRGRK